MRIFLHFVHYHHHSGVAPLCRNPPPEGPRGDVCGIRVIGQRMVMPGEIVSAGGGDRLELMVGKPMAIVLTRCGQRVMEHIVRIVHLVHAEDFPEAPFIEGAVVRHQRQTLDERRLRGPTPQGTPAQDLG